MKRIYKVVLAFVSAVLLIVPLNDVFAQAGENIGDNEDINVNVEQIENNNVQVESGDIHLLLTKNSEIIPVGSIAQFQLYVTTEGTKELYENVNLTINLPKAINNETIIFDQDLSELMILGIIPTYDDVNKVLTYHFDSVIGGVEASIPIKIKTINGSALNNVELLVSANIKEMNLEEKEVSESMVLSAASNTSLTNILEGIIVDDGFVKKSSVRFEDEAVFGTGLSVLKQENGTLKPKESSQVELKYVLADGFVYKSNSLGLEPTIDGQILTWKFDSNMNEDETYYFNVNFKIHAILEEELAFFEKVQNEANSSITFIDDSILEEQALTLFIITPDYSKEEAESFPDGAYAAQLSSPKDAFGGSSGSQNLDIEVYPGALLGWNMYLTSLTMTSPEYEINSYDMFIYPDANSDVVQFYSGDFFFRPNTSYKDAGYLPLEEQAYFSLSAKYTDSEDWDRLIPVVTPSKMYSTEELGLDANRELDYMRLHFHDGETNVFTDYLGYHDSWMHVTPGISASNMRLYTTSKEGYIGKLENKLGLSFSGWRADGYLTQYDSLNVPEDLKASTHSALPDGFEAFISNKTARVVEPPEGPTRYIKANAYFSNSSKNMITAGANKLNFTIGNDISSLEKLEGPFIAYGLLDEGITVMNPEEALGGKLTVLDENFKGTGKTLVKLVFDKDVITMNQQILMQVDVILDERMSYKTEVKIIGFHEKDFEVAKSSNANGTITVEDIDIYDLNNNGDYFEKVFVLTNEYTYRDAYEFAGMLLSDRDDLKVNTNKNTIFNTNINIFNNLSTPIKSMDLVYVLPNLEDTEVLTNDIRGSEFKTALEEPLDLGSDFEDLFEVYYSTSNEPTLKGIIDKNVEKGKIKVNEQLFEEETIWLRAEDVEDYSEISSIRIIKKTKSKLIRDSVLNLSVPLIASEDAEEGQKAFASYAFAINDSSVLETQALHIEINAENKVYQVNAEDVTYELKDAQALQASSTLLKNLREDAKITLYEEDVVVEDDINVHLTILDETMPIELGQYSVLVEWKKDDAVLASNTFKLDVINDDKPIEDKTPDTSVTNKSIPILVMIIGISLLVLGLGKTRKDN